MIPGEFAVQRDEMVQSQLLRRGIKEERLLRAFRSTPREMFLPEAQRSHAYEDRALPIGYGQTISQPYMVALTVEALRLTGSEHVLDVGTGSGYQAAILAELADTVYTIERIPELGRAAQERLTALGYRNIHFRIGDGTLGWPEAAPFDAIAVGAGAPHVPKALVEQLNEGGRLVLPLGPDECQELTLVEKRGGKTFQSPICACVYVKLVGADGWKEADF